MQFKNWRISGKSLGFSQFQAEKVKCQGRGVMRDLLGPLNLSYRRSAIDAQPLVKDKTAWMENILHAFFRNASIFSQIFFFLVILIFSGKILQTFFWVGWILFFWTGEQAFMLANARRIVGLTANESKAIRRGASETLAFQSRGAISGCVRGWSTSRLWWRLSDLACDLRPGRYSRIWWVLTRKADSFEDGFGN